MTAQARRIEAFQDDVATAQIGKPIASSVGFPIGRVRPSYPTSFWMHALRGRFDELTALERGWDGYDGLPVSFSCAAFAASLLERICTAEVPPPSLVPGSDGTIQIEWHRNGFDVEIDVLAPYRVVATRFSHLASEEETLELQTDFSLIVDWVNELAAPCVN